MKWMILRALRQRAGIELARARKNPNIIDFIKNRKINLVLDVGANTGQFGQALRDRGYIGRIISFEPVKEAFRELEKKARGDDLWTTSNLALGASNGIMEINVSKDSQFSSFNDLTEAGRTYDAKAEVKASQMVVVKTLDELVLPKEGNSQTLLKIDTQGYEQPVLEGAKQTIKRVSGVLLELPIINLYKDNWLFLEALTYMSDLGFVPAQFHPANIHGKARDSAAEFNCLFRRIDPAIDLEWRGHGW